MLANPLVTLWKSRTVIGAAIVALGQLVKLWNPEIGAALDAVGVILAGVGIRAAIAKPVTLEGHVPGAPPIFQRGDPL